MIVATKEFYQLEDIIEIHYHERGDSPSVKGKVYGTATLENWLKELKESGESIEAYEDDPEKYKNYRFYLVSVD